MADTTQPVTASGGGTVERQSRRLPGLDGLRGLAALFVVLHHCWLVSFPGFPENTGPAWGGVLMYGHLAVVVFIVLSGFSLAVAPARSGWRLDSMSKYAHRRAWRILPPYWPALLFSLLVAWLLVPQPGEGMPTIKSVAVFGLLVQDVFQAPSPNGAFWSIAIEAQLYLIFPMLLLVIRRINAWLMIVSVLLPVVVIGAFASTVPAAHLFMRFTPQLAVGFAAGMLAAGVLRSNRLQRYPWHLFALLALIPVIVVMAVNGSAWTVSNYLWIDLAFTPAIAMFLAGLAARKTSPAVGLLDSKPLRLLGGFSYSLYLTHAPIVIAIYTLLVSPRVSPGITTFLVTTAVAVPLCILFARGFAGLFEFPFQRNKSWKALALAAQARCAAVLRRRPFQRTARTERAAVSQIHKDHSKSAVQAIED